MRVVSMLATKEGQRGQTMIEMIAALFVISVGLVSILSLSTSNLRNQALSSDRLVASQLAREGVEIARNMRDTNWISGNAWDQGLVGTSSNCAVIASNLTSFDFTGIDCSSDLMGANYRLYRNTTTGVFNRDASQTPTQWYRRIALDPICLSGGTESVSTMPTCGTNQKIGIQVTADVASSVNPSPVRFVEQIYNWR